MGSDRHIGPQPRQRGPVHGPDDAPQARLRAVRQNGHAPARRPAQHEPRPALPVRRADGHQHVVPHLDRRIGRRIQPRRRLLVRMAQEELRPTLGHQGLALLGDVRHQLDGPQAQTGLQAAQPIGQEGQRQGVRGREAQRGRAGLGHPARLVGNSLHPRQHVLGRGPEPQARLGQGDRMRGPVEQGHAQPFFQHAYAAAERGLSHVPQLGRAREVAALGKDQEIFQPDQVHGRCLQSMEKEKTSIGRPVRQTA